MVVRSNRSTGLDPVSSLSSGGDWTPSSFHYAISPAQATTIKRGDLVVIDKDNTHFGTGGNGMLIKKYDYTKKDGSEGPAVGMFMSCSYRIPNPTSNYEGNFENEPVWKPGTTVLGNIRALVLDDPHLRFIIQTSSSINDIIENTYAFKKYATADIAKSRLIGSNFAMDDIATTQNGATNIGKYSGNPGPMGDISSAYLDLSTSTDGAAALGDYDHTLAALPLKLVGFDLSSANLRFDTLTKADGSKVQNNLYNQPFLKAIVVINNHIFKPGTSGIAVVAA